MEVWVEGCSDCVRVILLGKTLNCNSSASFSFPFTDNVTHSCKQTCEVIYISKMCVEEGFGKARRGWERR